MATASATFPRSKKILEIIKNKAYCGVDGLLHFEDAVKQINSNSSIEPGLGDFAIYLDINNNGKLDFDQPTRITGPDGSYRFSNLPKGTYK